MKKLLLILSFMTTTVFATEYRMVLPYGAGAQSDSVHRIIAEKFLEITGDKIVMENKASSNGAIAINYFKNNKNIDLLALGSGILVADPALREIVYNDTDFENLFYIGTAPFIWYTSPNSNIKSIDDLVKNTPKFTGSNIDTGKINTIIFAKDLNKEITHVPYKDWNSVFVGVVGGEIPIGVVNATKLLVEMHKTGKVVIIGSSYKDDFVIDDVRILSIPKHTNIQQFNGFISVAIRTDMDTERKQKLKEGLWKAIHNPEVREKLKSYFVMPDESDDMKTFNKFIQTSRVTMRKAIQL